MHEGILIFSRAKVPDTEHAEHAPIYLNNAAKKVFKKVFPAQTF